MWKLVEQAPKKNNMQANDKTEPRATLNIAQTMFLEYKVDSMALYAMHGSGACNSWEIPTPTRWQYLRHEEAKLAYNSRDVARYAFGR